MDSLHKKLSKKPVYSYSKNAELFIWTILRSPTTKSLVVIFSIAELHTTNKFGITWIDSVWLPRNVTIVIVKNSSKLMGVVHPYVIFKPMALSFHLHKPKPSVPCCDKFMPNQYTSDLNSSVHSTSNYNAHTCTCAHTHLNASLLKW